MFLKRNCQRISGKPLATSDISDANFITKDGIFWKYKPEGITSVYTTAVQQLGGCKVKNITQYSNTWRRTIFYKFTIITAFDKTGLKCGSKLQDAAFSTQTYFSFQTRKWVSCTIQKEVQLLKTSPNTTLE